MNCTVVQEQIAWEKELGAEARSHVLACRDCGAVASEYARLASLVEACLDAPVPSGFAERVMGQLAEVDMDHPLVGHGSVLESRWAQGCLAALGAVVAWSVLFRFVLALLLPVPL